MRRHGRKAFIRSVYSLPSLATLGNAICGFAAIYVAGLDPKDLSSADRWTQFFADPTHSFVVSAWLIFLAMLFDGIDGRLARFTRHTTDFGGQLDSLADMISFGAAPAFLATQVFKVNVEQMGWHLPVIVTRAVWAVSALYLSCAAIRLARFNVSNQHGEQHHYSFLGLPSPGAAGAVACWVLLHEEAGQHDVRFLHELTVCLLPWVVLITGILMVTTIRYAHVVNKYLRGRRSVGTILAALGLVLLLFIGRTYTLAAAVELYAFSGLAWWLWGKMRRRGAVQGAAEKVEPPESRGEAG